MMSRVLNRSGIRPLSVFPVVAVGFVVVVFVTAALTACEFDAPIRDNFSYRLTVVVAGTYDDPPTVQRLGLATVPLDETAPDSGVFVFEDTPDYTIDPYVIEIHVQRTDVALDGEYFSVTVRYEELGMIPVVARTLYTARREFGDGVDPEIRAVVSVPQ